MKSPSLLPALLALSMAPWLIWAQEPGAPPPVGDRTRNDIKEGVTRLLLTNESFIKRAARNNRTEEELAHLALQKSENPRLKVFAARMVKDHSAISGELRAIAQARGIALQKSGGVAESTFEKLNALSGDEFDRDYIRLMRKSHDNAVTLFGAAADDASLDSGLREFAAKTLPTLRCHRDEARKLSGHDHTSSAGL